jgi:hypothetical protein
MSNAKTTSKAYVDTIGLSREGAQPSEERRG